jgi:hypothetical protein
LQNKVEKLVEEYEQNLKNATDYYIKIMKLLETMNNDSSLKVTTRLTLATINFNNTIKQSGIS